MIWPWPGQYNTGMKAARYQNCSIVESHKEAVETNSYLNRHKRELSSHGHSSVHTTAGVDLYLLRTLISFWLGLIAVRASRSGQVRGGDADNQKERR